MNGVLRRIIASAVLLAVWGGINLLVSVPATLITGQVAGRQFESSDVAYAQTQFVFAAFNGIGLVVTLVFVLLLAALWWGPAKRALTAIFATLLFVAVAGTGTPTYAFFEKTDRTEIYTILPNESAFWIPDVGANKDTQARMDSEAYLNESKIAAKRFVIPHQKLTGSAGTSWTSGWDYYVPTGRLIIVDRTPFSREWVDAEDRGTSKSKEGFPCQTKEGINIAAGVSIGTSVLEANAAKFLYRFGVKAPVEKIKGGADSIETDGKIIFASVYYGRSLKEVMDDVGRKKVQTLVCDEIGTRTFDKANDEMTIMMRTIEQKVKTYFESVGITLDFIGWGDTFSFDPEVQAAVNRRYVASQDETIARMLAPYAETIQKLAAAQALRSFGDRSDGKLPTTIVGLPENVGGLLGTLLNTQPAAVPPTVPAK